MSATVVLLHGGDDVLLSTAVRERVAGLVGDGDRELMVSELTEAAYLVGEEYEIAPLVDAAQTPPFLTPRRVVVGRELGRFSNAESLGPLLGYLKNPLDTTDLVLVWEKGPALQRMAALPKSLSSAVAAAGGEVVGAGVPRGSDGVTQWMDGQIATAGLRLRAGAKRLLADRLGEDMSRLPSVLATLASAYGSDRTLEADDVAPFIGEAGSVPPWELTDAVAAGSIPDALEKLHRMLHGGGRNEMQVLATLYNHHARLLRLDGSGAEDDKAAAQLLGIKGSTFPALKALRQVRKLGSKKVARSIQLLAQADLDLRGATAMSPPMVLEVLVARLAQLNR
ncbi:DNA polymerase III subunit delta [Candidatus Poriferisocius sp.]|uniref:DNA polymerase III subunit delta n=1 Tax=Candidatus Poriferisocius sp. TaxID=3101276 RepID=UPI003B029F64